MLMRRIYSIRPLSSFLSGSGLSSGHKLPPCTLIATTNNSHRTFATKRTYRPHRSSASDEAFYSSYEDDEDDAKYMKVKGNQSRNSGNSNGQRSRDRDNRDNNKGNDRNNRRNNNHYKENKEERGRDFNTRKDSKPGFENSSNKKEKNRFSEKEFVSGKKSATSSEKDRRPIVGNDSKSTPMNNRSVSATMLTFDNNGNNKGSADKKKKERESNTQSPSDNKIAASSTTPSELSLLPNEIQSAANNLQTIFDIYRYAVTKFTKAELSYGQMTLNPWEDASFLILHELALPYSDPITHWGQSKLMMEEKIHLLSLIHQRITTKKPMPYLVNGCYQQGEYFYVDERVLIPRSFIGEILSNKELIRINHSSSSSATKTNNKQKLLAIMDGTNADMMNLNTPYIDDSLELGYDDYFGTITDETKFNSKSTNVALPSINKLNGNKYLFDHDKIEHVLDLCTGSGCLGILATKFFPNIRQVDVVDISADALEVAEYNIERKGLEDMINVYHGDLFDALPEFYTGEDFLEGSPSIAGTTTEATTTTAGGSDREMKSYHQQYDLIITNPPYVTKDDMEMLPKEFTYEPSLALEAGNDGLDIVVRILRESYPYLKDGGGLLCEVGQCKPALEKRFKHIFHPNSKKVHWISTAQSQDEVFYIKKEHLNPENFK